MKYIIDTEKIRVPKKLLGITLTGVDPDEQVRMTRFDIDRLEELTDDYVSEHFGKQVAEAEGSRPVPDHRPVTPYEKIREGLLQMLSEPEVQKEDIMKVLDEL